MEIMLNHSCAGAASRRGTVGGQGQGNFPAPPDGSRANQSKKRATIWDMHLASFAIRLLEVMFFVGMAGSAVVVLISFVEDAKELFGGAGDE
jgi:hypothetical protein